MVKSCKPFQYILQLVNVEASPVSDYIHLPSGVVFMSQLCPASIQRNTALIFGKLVFMWLYGYTQSHPSITSPGVVICAVTSWTTLMFMFYLVTMEVVFVSDDHNFYRGVMFIKQLWKYFSHINRVDIFVQLVIRVAIWVPVNPSINFFTRLVNAYVVTALQYVLYLSTMEEAPVSSNCNLLSIIFYGVQLGSLHS